MLLLTSVPCLLLLLVLRPCRRQPLWCSGHHPRVWQRGGADSAARVLATGAPSASCASPSSSSVQRRAEAARMHAASSAAGGLCSTSCSVSRARSLSSAVTMRPAFPGRVASASTGGHPASASTTARLSMQTAAQSTRCCCCRCWRRARTRARTSLSCTRTAAACARRACCARASRLARGRRGRASLR